MQSGLFVSVQRNLKYRLLRGWRQYPGALPLVLTLFSILYILWYAVTRTAEP
jgi:hypothetical protein